ncbi:MAG: hypothetical protein GY913_03395 [Proteobacteria bacterium]|nr:hypothetical protein [Pseudomonadota bacterium]
MRELYGLQLIEGRVFDGYSLDGRQLAFAETLRWRTEFALGPSASMSDLAGESRVPWTSDKALPLSFGFRKDPFGVGPALARPCVADMNLAFTLVDELDLAYTTATSVDGSTLAGGAVVAGFRITGTFVLQLPTPATSPWMDCLRAWGIG